MDANSLDKSIKQSDLIFVGTLTYANFEQGFPSGVYHCYMPTKFKISKLLKGSCPSDDVKVNESIVGPTERVTKDYRLSRTFYHLGKEYIVFASKFEGPKGEYFFVNAFPASAELNSLVTTRLVKH